MKSYIKTKLKRKGKEIYFKYFFNSDETINQIIYHLDSNMDLSNLSIIEFDVPLTYEPQIYELITYYPNKIKEKKYIDINFINQMYKEFSETIDIMKTFKSNSNANVRGLIMHRTKVRAKELNIPCTLNAEDLKLTKICPYLNVPLEYGNNKISKFSASIDKIIPELGYVQGNIQIISMIANNMKSNSTIDELITFSKNVLALHS
jgi:hypothetical protein